MLIFIPFSLITWHTSFFLSGDKLVYIKIWAEDAMLDYSQWHLHISVGCGVTQFMWTENSHTMTSSLIYSTIPYKPSLIQRPLEFLLYIICIQPKSSYDMKFHLKMFSLPVILLLLALVSLTPSHSKWFSVFQIRNFITFLVLIFQGSWKQLTIREIICIRAVKFILKYGLFLKSQGDAPHSIPWDMDKINPMFYPQLIFAI